MSYRDKARLARLSLTDDESQELLDSTANNATVPTRYMPPSEVNNQLTRVDQLLQNKKKGEAREILSGMHRYAARNPNYWWRVAQASSRRRQAIRALRKVVDLRPSDKQAWAMLRKLEKPLVEKNKEGNATSRVRRKKPKKTIRQRLMADLKLALFAVLAAGIISVLALIIIYL